MKKAFTLSEMLVCISIMAVLVVLFLSTTHAKPNSTMVMFRKAYNITSTNVYEMLQSAAYYETGLLSELTKTSEKVENEYPQGTLKIRPPRSFFGLGLIRDYLRSLFSE